MTGSTPPLVSYPLSITLTMFNHSNGKMEKKSGIRFHEAQVALTRAWVSGDEQTVQKEVTVTIPQEATEGLMVTPKTPPKTEMVLIPTFV